MHLEDMFTSVVEKTNTCIASELMVQLMITGAYNTVTLADAFSDAVECEEGEYPNVEWLCTPKLRKARILTHMEGFIGKSDLTGSDVFTLDETLTEEELITVTRLKVLIFDVTINLESGESLKAITLTEPDGEGLGDVCILTDRDYLFTLPIAPVAIPRRYNEPITPAKLDGSIPTVRSLTIKLIPSVRADYNVVRLTVNRIHDILRDIKYTDDIETVVSALSRRHPATLSISSSRGEGGSTDIEFSVPSTPTPILILTLGYVDIPPFTCTDEYINLANILCMPKGYVSQEVFTSPENGLTDFTVMKLDKATNVIYAQDARVPAGKLNAYPLYDESGAANYDDEVMSYLTDWRPMSDRVVLSVDITGALKNARIVTTEEWLNNVMGAGNE